MITATYVPTSYGTVTARAGGNGAAEFRDVERGATGTNGPGTVSERTALVDLRELELRVAREQAQLEASRRRLAEARETQNGPTGR